MIRAVAIKSVALMRPRLAGILWQASLVFALAGSWAAFAAAQSVPPPPVAPAATPAVAAPSKPIAPVKPAALAVTAKSEAKPLWSELTPLQQQSLKPLAGNWLTIGEGQKRKWLAISQNYQSLPAAEKAKMHSRMAEWSSLSQQQRAQARLNFAQTQSLSPSDKAANWQAYQALSAEEKNKLVAQAPVKPNTAAVAVKPVAPQKLAPVPVTRKTEKVTPEVAAKIRSVNQNTLLPHASHPAISKAPADTAPKSQ
jgi:hypothetical protein